MKQFIFCLSVWLVACNGGVSKKAPIGIAASTDSLINNPALLVDTPYRKGAILITKNDCLTCHRLKEKNVGPSYFAVAEKYQPQQGVVENLSQKIITGGKGLWGDAMMTPHPNLAFTDAEEMVRYILSLKTNNH